MQYANLGRTGLLISEVVLGTATFGESADAQAATAVVDRALELGINTFDTANAYCQTRSEELLGAALEGRRDRAVICTKVGLRPLDQEADHAVAMARKPIDHRARWAKGISPNDSGLSRKHIVAAVDASLRRLRTDYIDVYQVHLWDPSTPIEETLRALDDLVRAGKVLHAGCSQLSSWELYKSLWTSDVRGLGRYESIQLPYSLVQRDVEQDLLPACEAENVSVLAFRPLAGGILSGRWIDSEPEADSRFGRRQSYRSRFWTDAVREAVQRLVDLGKELDRTPDELAIAWVLAHPAVTAAVCGASRPDRLDGFARAADRPLSPEEMDAIRKVIDG